MGHYQEPTVCLQNRYFLLKKFFLKRKQLLIFSSIPSNNPLAPSVAFSKPVPAQTLNPVVPVNPSNQVHATHDLLVWYEIFELSPNGE